MHGGNNTQSGSEYSIYNYNQIRIKTIAEEFMIRTHRLGLKTSQSHPLWVPEGIIHLQDYTAF
jgi:hypothetical protein